MKRFIRKMMWKICGLQKLQDQIDSQYYFINKGIDITKFPKSTGNLALLHEADYWWLKIFDRICEKYNLVYWLDYGTLLGAIRHEGSIPWDDDLDVSMPSDDFKKFKSVIKSVLNQEDIQYSSSFSDEHDCCFGFGYKHEKTGVWLDVYPVYNCKEDENELFVTDGYIEFKINENSVYPLCKHQYEHTEFNIPKDYELYLHYLYGDYMCFPRTGILHHDFGRGPLAEWHKKYNISMEDIIIELKAIFEGI